MVLADSQMSHTMERGLGGGGFRSIKLNLTEGLAAIEVLDAHSSVKDLLFCSIPAPWDVKT